MGFFLGWDLVGGEMGSEFCDVVFQFVVSGIEGVIGVDLYGVWD